MGGASIILEVSPRTGTKPQRGDQVEACFTYEEM
jgi:hypothetical protein